MGNNMIEMKEPILRVAANDEFYAKVILEPLERGFGLTLGNCLRRVLLGSMPGAAIEGIRFLDGSVQHEFSAVKGVKEDVTEIVLNLKTLAVKTSYTDPTIKRSLRLYKVGPCVVTADDIEKDSEVQIVNLDQVICHLDEGSVLDLELTIGRGRGYKGAAHTSSENIGYIPIDSIYTPVKKVNYTVENMRVGASIDNDKLTLEVWTNGTFDAKETVSLAAKIVQELMTVFVKGSSAENEDVVVKNETDKKQLILQMTIEELGLSVRSYNCLKRANIHSIADLIAKSEDDMLKVRNLGKKSLDEIKEILVQMNLSFRNKED